MLVAYDGYIKIADFGLSKENIVGHTEAKSICGTAEYLAPEILQRVGHGKASDWWSFGGIIYEMLCGQPPFYSKDKEKLFRNIKYSEPRLDFPFLSENAKDICIKLLDKNPLTRLGSGPTDAEEIMAHPWFSSINWNSILKKEQPAPYRPQLDSEYCTKHFPQEFTQMKLTPNDVNSLKDQGKWKDFTFTDDNLDPAMDDGQNF